MPYLKFLPLLILFLLTTGVQIPATAEPVQALDIHQWSRKNIAQLNSFRLTEKVTPVSRRNYVSGNTRAIELGKRIFSDTRFSANGRISCASCHQAKKHFTDGQKLATAITTGTRNTPSIIGSSHNQWFFHDGRSDSLWAQALGPLENPAEHGGNRTQFAHLISNDPALRKDYEILFGAMPDLTDQKQFPQNAAPDLNKELSTAWQSMSLANQNAINQVFVNIGKSIAAYEETLQPTASKFDHYVQALSSNDTDKILHSLTTNELSGMRVFMTKGKCILCHSGPYFTDSGFHNIATVTTLSAKPDWGRYTGAKNVLDSPFNCRSQYNDDTEKHCSELDYIVLEQNHTMAAFKTPGLRNVSKTAPYMHDGQYDTLEQVVKHYVTQQKNIIGHSELQIPIQLTEQEQSDLVSFLRALDGH